MSALLPEHRRQRLVGRALLASAWLVAAFEDPTADPALRRHALAELRSDLDELGLTDEFRRADGALRLPRLKAPDGDEGPIYAGSRRA
jgi:hypothetical protein